MERLIEQAAQWVLDQGRDCGQWLGTQGANVTAMSDAWAAADADLAHAAKAGR